jgi:single-strand DNA-binding protein
MMTQTKTDRTLAQQPDGGDTDGCNEVRLRGKVSVAPEEKVLPSGDSVWVFRVVVPRAAPRGRTTVDTIDCAVWRGRARRTVAGLAAGDLVAVTGALRRRFFKAGVGSASRVEVEVDSLRVLRKQVTRRAAPS